MTLADQNVKLKEEVRAVEQLFGLSEVGDANDIIKKFGLFGIQESGDNIAENLREKEKEFDSLNAKCKMLENENQRLSEEHQNLLEESEKLTKELERSKNTYLVSINKFKKEFDSMNAKCETLEKEKQKLSEENENLLEEIKKLTKLNVRSRKVATHNIKLKMEIDSLQQEVNYYKSVQKDHEDGACKTEKKLFHYQVRISCIVVR